MNEILEWLSYNPIITTVLVVSFVIAFAAVVLIYLVAFFQGREISLWPPRIGPKPVAEDDKESVQNPDSDNVPIKTAKPPQIYLFGYFFVEEGGLEKKILGFIGPTFFYLMHGVIPNNAMSIEEAIEAIVLRATKENGLTQEDLLKAGLSRPRYQRLFLKTDKVILDTPYVFFKIGLQSQFSAPNCRWHDKKILAATWHDENAKFPLPWPNAQGIGEILIKDYIDEQLDRMILECVDVLIFRKHHEQIQFLLIHRNRSDEVKPATKDTWEYPKGGMRYYETPLEAVYREVQEETSITQGEMIFCSFLGWQTVDVSRRKKLYNTLRVCGYTLYYAGNPKKSLSSDEGHDDFKWVSLEEAKEMVWMEESSYAHNFFECWQKNQDEILHKAGIRIRR